MTMENKPTKRLIREGDCFAEIQVELIQSDDEWEPYLSVEDADKLDTVREALRRGDKRAASKYARVFRLSPVAV